MPGNLWASAPTDVNPPWALTTAWPYTCGLLLLLPIYGLCAVYLWAGAPADVYFRGWSLRRVSWAGAPADVYFRGRKQYSAPALGLIDWRWESTTMEVRKHFECLTALDLSELQIHDGGLPALLCGKTEPTPGPGS